MKTDWFPREVVLRWPMTTTGSYASSGNASVAWFDLRRHVFYRFLGLSDGFQCLAVGFGGKVSLRAR